MQNLDKYFETNIRSFDEDFIRMYSIYDQYLGDTLGAGKKLLEIGPGNGGFSFYLQGKFHLNNADIHLIDISQTVIDALKSDEHTKRYSIHKGDVIQFLELNTELFDCIILRHVLEHFEKKDIDRLIPLVEKTLSCHGKMLVEVPNLANSQFGSYMAYGDYSHHTHFTDKSLRECIYWNSSSLEVACHNSVYSIFCFRTIKWFCIFLIGKIIELFSAFLSLLTYAYGNKIFTPRLVAIITKKQG